MQSQSHQGLSEALTAIQTIEDEPSRIRALVEIVPQLPESAVDLLQHALTIAQSLADYVYRVQALVALAPHLPESTRPNVLQHAIDTAAEVEDQQIRVRLLLSIAPLLPESERDRIFGESLYAAGSIVETQQRARALLSIASLLPETDRLAVLERTLHLATEISNERRRAEILIEITSYIDRTQPDLLQQALNIAQSIADENFRTEAVSAITAKLQEGIQVESPSQNQFKDQSLSIIKKPHRSQCFTEPAIQLDLMLIPGGTFTMGSPPDELERWDDEGPQHEVTVSTFLMGRYPVTQAQWRAIATRTDLTRTDLKVKQDLDPDPSEFKADDRPVEQVSWYEAVEFCDRLSHLTQHTYRLPTEAEWEYACRAGTPTPFHFRKTITTDLANYRGEDDEDQPEKYPGHYGQGPKGEYRQTTTPVTHFHPFANAFGLCEMHGNVWEWCLDHWHGNYEGAPTDGSAWLTEDDEANRVIRGGSWYNNPRDCRSACRGNFNPGDRDDSIGFRVVCEVRGL